MQSNEEQLLDCEIKVKLKERNYEKVIHDTIGQWSTVRLWKRF
jgi:hypothetical protein